MSKYRLKIFSALIVSMAISTLPAGSASQDGIAGTRPVPKVTLEKIYFSADDCGWAISGSCECEENRS